MRVATVTVAVLLAGIMLACGGGKTKPKAQIIVGEKLKASGIKFGEWTSDFLTYDSTVEVPADGKALPADSITVRCEAAGGVKLKNGHSKHPALQPGEKGKIEVFPDNKSECVKVTIDLP